MALKIGFILLLTIAGKVLAFLRDTTIAAAFGVNGGTDAYFIAVNVPGIFWVAIFTTISSVFLPQYVAERHRSAKLGELYATEALRIYIMIAAVVSLLTIIFAKQIVTIAAPHSDDATIILATEFSRIIAAGFVLTAYVGVQNALQQANRRFVAPMSVPVINHSITILFILMGMYFNDLRLAVLGGVVGWIIQAPIQRWQTGSIYRSVFAFKVRRQTLSKITTLSIPVIFSVFLDQLNIFIGTVFASGFGSGAISHLNYASRLTMFAAGLFSWMVAYFIFPKLAENAASNDIDANRKLISSSTQLVMLLTTPMIIILLICNREAIGFIYGRGAFTESDVVATARLSMFYAISIIFISLREIFSRVIFSFVRAKSILVISFIAMLTNLLLSWTLSKMLGIEGIAIASVLAAIVFLAMQIILVKLIDTRLIDKGILLVFLKIFIAAGIASSTGYAAKIYFIDYGSFITLLTVSGVSVSVFGICILIIYRAMGENLIEMLIRKT